MKIILFILLLFSFSVNAQKKGIISSQATSSVTPILYDDFETGSASTDWGTNTGDVDSYTNFGITGPTDGGSYGIEFGSTERSFKNFGQTYEEIWMECDARTGSSTAYTYVTTYATSGVAALVYARFSNASSPTFQILVLDPYVGYSSTETFSASTWYKVKVRCVFDGTDYIVQGWVDSGSGYTLVIDETGTNTNTIGVGLAGASNSGQTGYIDNFGFYESDPN